MTDTDYFEALAVAGEWVRGSAPVPLTIGAVRKAYVATGVYIACDREGRVRYVGSAARPGNPYGVGTRVHEHRLRERANWRRIWLLPLWDDTPWPIVRAIEGRVIRLLAPTDNRVGHRDLTVPSRSGAAAAAPDSSLGS